MGLDINAVRFLIDARKRGAAFGDVLTLGRQDLNVYPAKMAQLLSSHGFPAEAFSPQGKDSLFADPVFKSLGAASVSAMDVSNFEGASFVHDLNQPIGADLRERFDLVYDGGTLEHVFNYPTALRSCMEMLRPGGHLFLHTITNNWCGHGFYQFSPELFFRTLHPDNGFEVTRMILHAVGPYGRWYEVKDPESIRSRVELITFCPVHLLVQARRTRVVPIFQKAPQQSDYTPRWVPSDDASAAGSKAAPPPVDYSPSRPRLARWFPNLARLVHVARMGLSIYQSHTVRNRKCFQPVKKP